VHLESLRSAASKDGVGLFFDREEYNGRTILVRFTWTHSGGIILPLGTGVLPG
jgi:hypothetical protein